MTIKSFEHKTDPEYCTGGWGYNYTYYRLVCKCGSMGPQIKLTDLNYE